MNGVSNISDGNTGKAIIIDTTGPTSSTKITGVKFDPTGTLTLTGEGFGSLNAPVEGASGTNMKSYFDWTKFTWDTVGTGSADKTLALSDVNTAVVTSGTTLTIALNNASTLTGLTGFGREGGGDNVDITNGFLSDYAGNAASADGAANVTPTFSDTTAPTITSFTVDKAAGSYNVGEVIEIQAVLSENVISTSTFNAVLNTGDTIALNLSAVGNTLTGNYTVASNHNFNTLKVSDVTGFSGVVDLYNNSANTADVPDNSNIDDNKLVKIDNIGIFANPSSYTKIVQNDGNTTANSGDALVFKFTEGVPAGTSGKDLVQTAITTATTGGTSYAWTDSDKTLTATLNADYTLGTITLTNLTDLAGNITSPAFDFTA